jgi:hypothetical protein
MEGIIAVSRPVVEPAHERATLAAAGYTAARRNCPGLRLIPPDKTPLSQQCL